MNKRQFLYEYKTELVDGDDFNFFVAAWDKLEADHMAQVYMVDNFGTNDKWHGPVRILAPIVEGMWS